MSGIHLALSSVLKFIQKENQRLETLDIREWSKSISIDSSDPFPLVNYVKLPHPVLILINKTCFDQVLSYRPVDIDKYYFKK